MAPREQGTASEQRSSLPASAEPGSCQAAPEVEDAERWTAATKAAI